MRVYPLADPRLLLNVDIIAEHHAVHAYLRSARPILPEDTIDFLIFRHELIRTALNARTGMRHCDQATMLQGRHPSQLPPKDLLRLEDYHLRAMTTYERWVYLRKRTDIELIDLLFHALMKRIPFVPVVAKPTPWHGSTPNAYLSRGHDPDHRRHSQAADGEPQRQSQSHRGR